MMKHNVTAHPQGWRRRVMGVVGALVIVGSALALAASAASATAPDAHLAAATITFATHDDDKDFDTLVRAQVETFGRVAADFTDFGIQYVDNSVHGPFMMHPDTGVVAAALNTGVVRITITPNGHDTWRFSYELTLFFSDGTAFVIRAGNLSLSESSRELTTPFTLTTQVAVPNVIGDLEGDARATLEAAGLTVGSMRHVIDRACTFIDQVSNESPRAGTIVNLGTAVNLTIGDKPRTPCP